MTNLGFRYWWKFDYHFDHELTVDEVTEIQDRVNQVIQDNLPVTETLVSREEAVRLYNTEKLPEGVDGQVRIVHMGDYDACPCIGEHVATTREIGGFRITTTSYENNVLRIRYKLYRQYELTHSNYRDNMSTWNQLND